MPRKEKRSYAGEAPDDVYVVVVDGEFRIYYGLTQANARYLDAKEKGQDAEFWRYYKAELIGK